MSETDDNDTNDTVLELKTLVAELAARVQTLEEQAAQRHPEVSEEVLLAISAACAAYLGKRATIKQVHLHRGSTWASQGRAVVQQSQAGLARHTDRQARLTRQARGMT